MPECKYLNVCPRYTKISLICKNGGHVCGYHRMYEQDRMCKYAKPCSLWSPGYAMCWGGGGEHCEKWKEFEISGGED